MDIRRRHTRDERGDSFVVTLVAVLILLGVFLMATNLVVDEYGQGVLRTAVDEAAQAGAEQGASDAAASACQAKESEVMSGLLSGTLADGVHLSCAVDGDQVVATATGHLPAWLPPVPEVGVHALGTSVLETPPTSTSP